MTADTQSPVAVAAPEIDVKDVGNEVIVEGPALKGEYKDKMLAKVRKEGGKKGIEIEGAADMGGLQYFNTRVELPEGNMELLVESVKAMNAASDPSEEERKGGAGKLGKIVLCYTESMLNLVAYVPTHKTDEVSATEWLSHVVKMGMGTTNGKAEDAPVLACEGCDTKSWATCAIAQNMENNVFPIKLRDFAISEGYAYLRKKGLFPEDNEDDDDEFVFGDDDFPQA